MEKELNVYFDTEFTELTKNCELISIGLVTDNDDYFYAELGDYNKNNINDWAMENVIKNLLYNKGCGGIKIFTSRDGKTYNFDPKIPSLTNVEISKKDVKIFLTQWFKIISSDKKLNINLISDVCHYDMVLFADIFSGAMNMPKFISPSCYDINQDIARYLGITQQEAFNLSREDFCKEGSPEEDHKGNAHNSLYDAQIIRECYRIINRQ